MGSKAPQLLEAALKLPPEARAAMAGALLDSLDTIVDADAEQQWEQENVHRLKALDLPQSRVACLERRPPKYSGCLRLWPEGLSWTICKPRNTSTGKTRSRRLGCLQIPLITGLRVCRGKICKVISVTCTAISAAVKFQVFVSLPS
ncbi:MAG: addiction module protein [Nitrospira sp.]|nr:addiction module protein [Nitrospira sp.]